MLNKFRSLYPQGSILTELITINQGKYIVKVLIKVENITLASSLAAAETVESAEDQARNRALSLLNLEEETLFKNNNNIFNAIPKNKASTGTNIKQETHNLAVQNNILSPESEPPVLFTQKDSEINTLNQEEENNYSPEILPQVPPLDNNETLENPDDFSDLVAKTNLELKRLGWTNEQGRDYLLQTYGKRSRQLLNQEELREFLAYLEQQ